MNELEKSRAQRIVSLHNQITDHLKMSLGNAIEIGELLTKQKESLDHGEFTPWIKENLPFTDRTAQNYMRLYRERDRLKNETVSDFKSAYRLLVPPKQNSSPLNDQASHVTLTLFDEDTVCMRVSKEITDKCPHAILHPIKMDSLLNQYRGDGDISCSDILDIVATRERLTLADYIKYVPLKIAAIKADLAHDACFWEIEDAEEDGKHLTTEEINEIKSRAQKHRNHHDKLNKQIKSILIRNNQLNSRVVAN